MLRELAALPLAEDIPIAHNSCRRGPRSVGWRDDHPAALEWLEAQARPSQAPGSALRLAWALQFMRCCISTVQTAPMRPAQAASVLKASLEPHERTLIISSRDHSL